MADCTNQRSEISSGKLRQQYEGQLYKYTNVMKGWQYRWFILDPETGVLDYFLNESERKQRPRGSVHLAGAVISPSDEDSNTFTVNSATGEMFKLRAADARARQEWVNRIRAVAERHTMAIAQSNPPLPPREHHSVTVPVSHNCAVLPSTGPSYGPRVQCSLAVLDAFSTVREQLHLAEQNHYLLVRAIDDLPSSGASVRNLDEDLLILKATTQATLVCLGQCLSILQQQQMTPVTTPVASITHVPAPHKAHCYQSLDPPKKNLHSPPFLSTQFEELESKQSLLHDYTPVWDTSPSTPPQLPSLADTKVPEDISSKDEITDEDDVSDDGSIPAEEHKSVILHLLSQLKLGMDLTRVVLPTFILERRSLLEMFADCMGHPDYFVRIADESTPQGRMLALLEWYLTSFHMGHKGSIAKKPYNPIIGETFHCSWLLPIQSSSGGLGENNSNEEIHIRYVAEQVSHHPPVTAFYVECPEKQMCLNASIWTKSNFSGMSVGVNMVGDVSLYLGTHGERYDFTLPAAYARSIISVPWVELGGKVTISCSTTGYSANVIFHTKPFYGGKVHQVTAEVKNEAGLNVCKVQGEWNNYYEFTYLVGESKRIEIKDLRVFKKRVRRLNDQGNFESRKLWSNVTKALKEGDINTATKYKRELEECQRLQERIRRDEGILFPTQYFHKVDESWIYNNLLVKV
ncbi:oxysterol-binding protein-related protein 11 isoform X2 [Anabrus simplex]|uniref:oxysterol-binding protein-related protein 11 isoform X2 n=1 Tax=Anabrus simplex TaxID=316456 RepID=UPI0035A38BFF